MQEKCKHFNNHTSHVHNLSIPESNSSLASPSSTFTGRQSFWKPEPQLPISLHHRYHADIKFYRTHAV
jgi:hypothetical protein